MIDLQNKYLKIKNIFFPKSRDISIYIVFITILFIRIIYSVYWKWGVLCPDSYGYMEYDFISLLKLNFADAGRTPVYPLILQILRLLFGEDRFLVYVVFVQCIVSYISVLYFFRICSIITAHHWIKITFTFLYGITSVICGWDYVILTESFAISGTVFFIYHIFCYMLYEKSKNGFMAIILLFFLIFLRPSFLLLYVISFCFLILRILFKKNNTYKIFLTCISGWIIIMLYSCVFYTYHGIFSVSDPLPRQLLYACIERDYYKNYQDRDFVLQVETSLKGNENNVWNTMTEILGYYGKGESQKIAKECIINNLPQYINDEFLLSLGILCYDFGTYAQAHDNMPDIFNTYFTVWNSATNLVKPIHGIFVGIITLFLSLWNLFRKKMAWIACGLSVFIFGIFISTMILTCGEYARTMIHIVPFVFVGIVYLTSKFVYGEDYFIDSFPVSVKERETK